MSAVIAEKPAPRRNLPPSLSVLRKRTRMHVEFVDVDGVRVRVGVRRGRGRPMLLFNGIGANLDMTLPLVNALDDVEVIVFDVPGAGDSPALNMPHRFGWLAKLSARLLDRLGYDMPVNVAGVSWGGALAQQFALDFPERTNRLVLAATSTGMLALPARSNVLKRLTNARRFQKNETLAQLAPALYGGLMRRRPELLERNGHFSPDPSTRGYINQLLAGLGWTSVHRLHRLRCPTLIMGGDDDPVMPLVNIRLLYWLIPKSYLHIVRGGGHLFLLVRANESAAVIKRFINERRYDGTDGQDYYAAQNLPPDGVLRPLTAAADSLPPAGT
ncbi:poly(3-hydroxyalkanoate) depolymerase [Endozoicomonas sp. G2_2]|uniref:poly(3-hydroxyalkanoate) depolymerase n=1 Tax=Endozoicomonas sp. G2_2 TaxID=2821092 RepID=UPI001AD97D78|nr:poly(3-hydroxyalkanoate) depolymerase [Endozoicomonas sp. G2_2]